MFERKSIFLAPSLAPVEWPVLQASAKQVPGGYAYSILTPASLNMMCEGMELNFSDYKCLDACLT